ncbi:MAG: hypothetical protein KF855_14765 [Acidobacteria bacterium]|nr:hypothetical protein [Acidobacteriota bacterium]
MSKSGDALAILKLYELRRDSKMRAARQWYTNVFDPQSAQDLIALFASGERASAYYRMVTSYWDTAAALVLNGGIDKKMFLDANTEHVLIYAKIADFLPEFRELTRESDYLINLEYLVRSLPDAEEKIAHRKQLGKLWIKAARPA